MVQIIAMQPMKKLPPKTGPEAIIQRRLIAKLQNRGWFVKETHGNMFQSGFPDLFACHSMYGSRWIEVKNPKAYRFTAAQLRDFPLFSAHGCGVWVLVDDSDFEIAKLQTKPNWGMYLM